MDAASLFFIKYDKISTKYSFHKRKVFCEYIGQLINPIIRWEEHGCPKGW